MPLAVFGLAGPSPGSRELLSGRARSPRRGSTIRAGLSIIRGITGTLDTTTMSRRAKGLSVAEIEPGEYVDTYINMRSKEQQSEETLDPNIRRWFLKSSPDILGGYTTEHMVGKMTAAGIERVSAQQLPVGWHGGSADDPYHVTTHAGGVAGELRRDRRDL